METVDLGPSLALDFPFFLSSELCHDFEAWTPFLELEFPLQNNGCRNHDQVWPPNSLFASQVGQHSDRLHGLSQAHFVSQNAIDFLVMKRDQPLRSDQLLLTQVVLEQKRLLHPDCRFLQGGSRGLLALQCLGEVLQLVGLIRTHLILVVTSVDGVAQLTFAMLALLHRQLHAIAVLFGDVQFLVRIILVQLGHLLLLVELSQVHLGLRGFDVEEVARYR